MIVTTNCFPTLPLHLLELRLEHDVTPESIHHDGKTVTCDYSSFYGNSVIGTDILIAVSNYEALQRPNETLKRGVAA